MGAVWARVRRRRKACTRNYGKPPGAAAGLRYELRQPGSSLVTTRVSRRGRRRAPDQDRDGRGFVPSARDPHSGARAALSWWTNPVLPALPTFPIHPSTDQCDRKPWGGNGLMQETTDGRRSHLDDSW